ncbi:class E sortase [Streptomyces canus]|uniref:class E sortase n=1 Tax=Streptomyces canus TaxID=58343 RepID=UPI00037200ED|nr:class E sortase [Streptomyces canus]
MKKASQLLGIGLILVGLLLGGFTLLKTWHSDNQYRAIQQTLHKEIKTSAEAPHEGGALATLRIPRFGSGYDPVIVEGVSQSALAKGPGHFPGTAMPGEIGNFAIAGHRTGWGQPFHRLPDLTKGDEIKVYWHRKAYTYRVTRTEVVKPSDVGVVLPVPNRPGARPDKARITLTTCTDRGWNGTYIHRLVVWGELEK